MNSRKGEGEMTQRPPSARARSQSLQSLSDREREVLSVMAAGRTNHAICDVLALNPKTVESHVRAIFRKLGLRQTADETGALWRYSDSARR